MFRKLLLLICIAFVVVCYGYPCVVLPFGSHTYSKTVDGEKQELSMQFHFDGTITSEQGDAVLYYKLKGNTITIYEDENLENEYVEIKLKNAYEFEFPMLLTSVTLRNNIGMFMSIGVGALALVLVLSIPSNKKRR